MSSKIESVLESLNRQPVNIVEDVFTYLSPFSAHRIEIWGEVFPTFEHAYQSFRFKDSPEKNAIKTAKSPLTAWILAQDAKKNPEIFIEHSREVLVNVVEELFKAKYNQHEDVRKVLDMTKGRGILKVFGKDNFWGTGEDGSGENMMGKIWMKIRDDQ